MLAPGVFGRPNKSHGVTSEEPNSAIPAETQINLVIQGGSAARSQAANPIVAESRKCPLPQVDRVKLRSPACVKCRPPVMDQALHEPESILFPRDESSLTTIISIREAAKFESCRPNSELVQPQLEEEHNSPRFSSRMFREFDVTFSHMFIRRADRIALRSDELNFAMGFVTAGTPSHKNASPFYPVLWGLGVPCFGVAISLAGFAYFPLGDVMDDQSSWWRCMAVCIVTSFAPLLYGYSLFWPFALQSKFHAFPGKLWLAMCTVGICTWVFLWSLCTWLWVEAFGQKLPVPFLGVVCYAISLVPAVPLSWFWMPTELRNKPFVRKTRCYGTLGIIGLVVLYNSYYLVFSVVVRMPPQWQWVMAPVVLACRETFAYVTAWFFELAGLNDDPAVTVILASFATTVHAYFLSLIVGGAATLLTTLVFIGLDTANNVYLGIKVYRTWAYGKHDECQLICQEVVEIETLEAILPLVFLIFTVVAFHSPNAKVLGGVRATSFHFVEISDINATAWNILLMVAIDAVSLVVLGFCLWRKCRVNIWQVYLHIRRHYSPITQSFQVAVIAGLPCQLVTACGADLTFQFKWLNE